MCADFLEMLLSVANNHPPLQKYLQRGGYVISCQNHKMVEL